MAWRRPDPDRPPAGRTAALRATLAVVAALATASCAPPPEPSIEVTELDGPFAPIDVTLGGLAPGSDVTLEASAVVGDVPFGSRATFTVPDDGSVDIAEVAPSSGHWETADPMAPIWAMISEGRVDLAAWDQPHTVDLELRDGDGETLAQTSIERPGSAPDVEIRPVDDDGLVAEYAVPANVEAGERRPAVLVFGGSEGGLSSGASTARWLAALGYPALGISYFGAEGQPAELEQVPVGTFLDALDWLHEQPEVDTERVVTFGASRGGEMALWLAAERTELVHAAIAPTGAGSLYCGYPDNAVPAWTLDDEPLADICPFAGGVEDLRLAAIGVEEIAGPVVLACGTRDELWSSCAFAQDVVSRRGAGATALVLGEGAGHAVSLAPYVPVALGPDVFEGLGITSVARPGATHQARVDFWEAVVVMLDGLRDGG
ncbi:acyl-CoA thioesterase/BAAT N-terminal domain-containing protein [Isoptericola croceus]|uniref:acyl-CoA thioesterase/BAAT N-terminal domain-containing protein n=1 Tax=Isoptericola croceus TaxID=3031406 RepID=UPI0023F908A1|nr:acyl-CoA thioesterase/BAAT N-terminal domain-containing protein [Isoptericola croceus]